MVALVLWNVPRELATALEQQAGQTGRPPAEVAIATLMSVLVGPGHGTSQPDTWPDRDWRAPARPLKDPLKLADADEPVVVDRVVERLNAMIARYEGRRDDEPAPDE